MKPNFYTNSIMKGSRTKYVARKLREWIIFYFKQSIRWFCRFAQSQINGFVVKNVSRLATLACETTVMVQLSRWTKWAGKNKRIFLIAFWFTDPLKHIDEPLGFMEPRLRTSGLGMGSAERQRFEDLV